MAETSHLWAVIQEWLDLLPYPPSQSKLAKRLGLQRNAVSEWKYGTTRPTPDHLRALADEMTPVAGPDVYDRLLVALNRDLGYEPRSDKAVG